MRKAFYMSLGWICVLLSAIGAVLPLLPTTPFLILALALFTRSSPRFRKMLLNNKWFGPHLKNWEESRTITRKAKIKAILVIILTFGISIFVLSGRIHLQIFLLILASCLLVFMWRLKEPS